MMKHITCAAVFSVMLAAPAAAETPSAAPGPGRQQARIAQRVRAGVQAGQLTRAEVTRIRRQMQALRTRANALRSDGRLSQAERARLRRAWQRISRLVYVARHSR